MVAQAFSGARRLRHAIYRSNCQPASGAKRSPCTLRSSCEPRDDRVDAARARVLNRAAAKRREARAEDHAGIDQVRILDDALAEHGDRFIDQRQHQAILQIRRRRRPAVGGFCGLSSRQT